MQRENLGIGGWDLHFPTQRVLNICHFVLSHVRPDQVKFHHFGKTLKVFGYSLRVILNWEFFVHNFLFFLKMGQPGLFFVLFLSFQTNITILTTNKCEKCPSSIQRRDSNSQPSDYESPPLTTRPGLPRN